MSYHSEMHAQIGFARHEWSYDRFGAEPVLPADIEETAPALTPCPACEGTGRDLAGDADWLPCPDCGGSGEAER